MNNKILDQREVPDHLKPTTAISTTQELYEKENLPPPETEKTLYHFTPSASDDTSAMSSYRYMTVPLYEQYHLHCMCIFACKFVVVHVQTYIKAGYSRFLFQHMLYLHVIM